MEIKAVRTLHALLDKTEALDDESQAMLADVLDRHAVREICAVLNKPGTWTGQTVVAVADIVEGTGRTIRPAAWQDPPRFDGTHADGIDARCEDTDDEDDLDDLDDDADGKDRVLRRITADTQVVDAIYAVLRASDWNDYAIEVIIDLVECTGRDIRMRDHAECRSPAFGKDYNGEIQFRLPDPQAIDAVHALLEGTPAWSGEILPAIGRTVSLTRGSADWRGHETNLSNGRPEFDGRPDRPDRHAPVLAVVGPDGRTAVAPGTGRG